MGELGKVVGANTAAGGSTNAQRQKPKRPVGLRVVKTPPSTKAGSIGSAQPSPEKDTLESASTVGGAEKLSPVGKSEDPRLNAKAAGSVLSLIGANRRLRRPETGGPGGPDDLNPTEQGKERITALGPTTEALAADSAHLTRAMADGLDRLAEKYPEVNRDFASRFLEMALVGGVMVPKSVLDHEDGHALKVLREGGTVERIDLTGWSSGRISWRHPPGLDTRGQVNVTAGGVNQRTENADYIYRDWARTGSVSYPEAMGYLLAQTDLALYSRKAMALGDQAPPSDDIASYVKLMEERGHKISSGQILAMAAATDLASAPLWAALRGQLDFLRSGDREVEMPTFEIGGLEAAFPNLHTYLTGDGPVLGGSLMVNPKEKHPVELSLHGRYDGSAVAAGAKLHDATLTDRLSLNPYLRVTRDEEHGDGFLVGSEVRYDLGEGASLVGQVELDGGDLLSDEQGRGGGLNAFVGLSFSR